MLINGHVIVVAPDLRRLKVNTLPTTTFGEITRQAVQGFGLTDDVFGLKYKRTLLESSTQVRFFFTSSITQAGVMLDLVKVEHVLNKSVKVVLQLPLGRLSGDFKSNMYIPDVLKAFEQSCNFKIVSLNPANQSVIQVPELLISGRRYGVEEWRSLRISDVADQTGLLMRAFWRDCKYSLMDIETMLFNEPTKDDGMEAEKLEPTLPPLLVDEAVGGSDGQPIIRREFKFVDPSPIIPSSSSPSDSFELTALQLRQMAKDAKNRTKRLEDAPLVSRRAWEAKRRADLLSQYPNTVIRLKLPDKQVVEVQFKSTELGKDLYSFALQFGKFGCLVSAGKAVKQDIALIDQGLIPNAIVWAIE